MKQIKLKPILLPNAISILFFLITNKFISINPFVTTVFVGLTAGYLSNKKGWLYGILASLPTFLLGITSLYILTFAPHNIRAFAQPYFDTASNYQHQIITITFIFIVIGAIMGQLGAKLSDKLDKFRKT